MSSGCACANALLEVEMLFPVRSAKTKRSSFRPVFLIAAVSPLVRKMGVDKRSVEINSTAPCSLEIATNDAWAAVTSSFRCWASDGTGTGALGVFVAVSRRAVTTTSAAKCLTAVAGHALRSVVDAESGLGRRMFMAKTYDARVCRFNGPAESSNF